MRSSGRGGTMPLETDYSECNSAKDSSQSDENVSQGYYIAGGSGGEEVYDSAHDTSEVAAYESTSYEYDATVSSACSAAVTYEVTATEDEHKRGGIKLPTRYGVPRFLSIERIVSLLTNVDSCHVYEFVPEGIKENVSFIVDNTRNIQRWKEGLRNEFWDDCGAWSSMAGVKCESIFISLPGKKLKQVYVKNNMYCLKRSRQKRNLYIPCKRQPKPHELVVVGRYYIKHKLSNDYVRRISWIINIEGSNVAFYEYKGKFPGRAAHGNAPTDTTSPYIRTKPTVIDHIKQEVRYKNPQTVFNESICLDGLRSVQQVRSIKAKQKSREKIAAARLAGTYIAPVRKRKKTQTSFFELPQSGTEDEPSEEPLSNHHNDTGAAFYGLTKEGNDLPIRGCTYCFSSIEDIIIALSNVDKGEVYDSVPLGVKENKSFIVDNTRNVRRRQNGFPSQFFDDCGPWLARTAAKTCCFFVCPSENRYMQVFRKNKLYCLKRVKRKKIVYIPFEAQPKPNEVLVVRRYYIKHELSTKYERRITFIVNADFPYVAIYEYKGKFPEMPSHSFVSSENISPILSKQSRSGHVKAKYEIANQCNNEHKHESLFAQYKYTPDPPPFIELYVNEPGRETFETPTNTTTITYEWSGAVTEPAEGGSELPIRGGISCFMSIEETVTHLLYTEKNMVYERVPLGIKENKIYIVDNTRNIQLMKEGLMSEFWDDCGAWSSRSLGTSKRLYIFSPGSKLERVILKNDIYCVRKTRHKKDIFIPREPQPISSEVIAIHRYHAKHKLSSSYERRITWISNWERPKVACYEYKGKFPGWPHDGIPYTNMNKLNYMQDSGNYKLHHLEKETRDATSALTSLAELGSKNQNYVQSKPYTEPIQFEPGAEHIEVSVSPNPAGELFSTVYEPDVGGDELPTQQGIPRFVNIDETVAILSETDGQIYETIPFGFKENKRFVVDNTQNIQRKRDGLMSEFLDDCEWCYHNAVSNKSLFICLTNDKFMQIYQKNGIYCLRKVHKKTTMYIPCEPQPQESEVLMVNRYYTKHKLSSEYVRRVSWVGNTEGPKVALYEYKGQHPRRLVQDDCNTNCTDVQMNEVCHKPQKTNENTLSVSASDTLVPLENCDTVTSVNITTSSEKYKSSQKDFMIFKDIINALLHVDINHVHESVPLGIKENVSFIVDNTHNVQRIKEGLQNEFQDDCDSWLLETAYSTVNYYICLSDNEFQQVFLKNKMYCHKKKNRRKTVYIACKPQPKDNELVVVWSYYTMHKETSEYVRRISWLQKEEGPHVACYEYNGVFPGGFKKYNANHDACSSNNEINSVDEECLLKREYEAANTKSTVEGGKVEVIEKIKTESPFIQVTFEGSENKPDEDSFDSDHASDDEVSKLEDLPIVKAEVVDNDYEEHDESSATDFISEKALQESEQESFQHATLTHSTAINTNSSVKSEMAVGGNELPIRGDVVSFMSIEDVLSALSNLDPDLVYDSVPCGVKENKSFIVDNTRNTERTKEGLKSVFTDDCGPWSVRNTSRTESLFINLPCNQLQQVYLKKDAYYLKRTYQKSCIYKLCQHQPDPSEVIAVCRYYSKHKLSTDYVRRITWLGNTKGPKVACYEYKGNFPGNNNAAGATYHKNSHNVQLADEDSKLLQKGTKQHSKILMNLLSKDLCEGGSDLPLREGIVSFLSIDDLVSVLTNPERDSIHKSVPSGIKENKSFIIDDTQNVQRRTSGLRSKFLDDCGTWSMHSSVKTENTFLCLPDNKFKQVYFKNGIYCQRKCRKNSYLYIPCEPQPRASNVLIVHRYYSKHNLDSSYERRISWIVNSKGPNVACYEYKGKFPGNAIINTFSPVMELKTPSLDRCIVSATKASTSKHASGGNNLPIQGGIPHFLNIHEIVTSLSNVKSHQVLERVPLGSKENIFFIVDDTENNERRKLGSKSVFQDDCWWCRNCAASMRYFFISVPGKKYQQIFLKNDIYCLRKDKGKNKKDEYIPCKPQPQPEDVLEVRRYLTKHKLSKDYMRKVTWLGCQEGLRVACYEYRGKFPAKQLMFDRIEESDIVCCQKKKRTHADTLSSLISNAKVNMKKEVQFPMPYMQVPFGKKETVPDDEPWSDAEEVAVFNDWDNEPAIGGNDLPHRQGIPCFMIIPEIISALTSPDAHVCESVPLGVKENKSFIIDNTRNIKRKKDGLTSEFSDDCGLWARSSYGSKSFIRLPGNRYQEIIMKDNVYCVRKEERTKTAYIPCKPQPKPSEIIELHRYYTKHEFSPDYIRRITWVGNPKGHKVACYEYKGKYPGKSTIEKEARQRERDHESTFFTKECLEINLSEYMDISSRVYRSLDGSKTLLDPKKAGGKKRAVKTEAVRASKRQKCK